MILSVVDSEPRDFESLRIEMPDKKRPYLLSSLPKTFTLKEIKAAFIVLHNIPISEKRAAEVSMCVNENMRAFYVGFFPDILV